MALTITAQHGFLAYQDGTVILPRMGVIVNGDNGFVQYVKQDGTVTGTDFSSNNAILFPYCISSSTGLPVTPKSGTTKWHYGNTTILFSDTATSSVSIDGTTYSYKPCTNFLDDSKKPIFGLTTHTITESGKNYDVPALIIIRNIASATIFSDVTFRMEGTTADGHYFTCDKVLPIQLTEGNAIGAFITDNGDSVISQGETTCILLGGVQENGVKVDVTKLSNVKWERLTSDGWTAISEESGMFSLATESVSTSNKTKITIYEKAINASILIRFSADYNGQNYKVTHEVLDMNDGYTFYDGCNYPGEESSVNYGDAVTLSPVVKVKGGDVDKNHTWSLRVIMTDKDGNPIKKKSSDTTNWIDTITPLDGSKTQSYAYADLFAESRKFINFAYNVSC